jgi:hypothetical protein
VAKGEFADLVIAKGIAHEVERLQRYRAQGLRILDLSGSFGAEEFDSGAVRDALLSDAYDVLYSPARKERGSGCGRLSRSTT